ncbi:SWIM zinc finger family protein [Streptomyces termitum]|uniref:SWIM zinc finger family protein n=1 Tax=Streptomyces termitum TaxID=67368 RepID=UPI0033ADEEA7
MNAMGVRWTSGQVLALAPDEASREAARGFAAVAAWEEAGASEELLWGRREGVEEGGGGGAYRTVVDPAGPAHACTCGAGPSLCVHALGLLLLRAADPAAVPDAAGPPAWAVRARAALPAARPAAARPGPADPAAARRRAERRAARITAGAEELERRLADLVRGGLAAAGRPGPGPWEETAARMVDAQAPGLAARVRELGALPGSGPDWPARLLEECALTHLLDRAWLAVDRLPAPLATTVRTRVGLPSPPGGTVLRDRWQVLARYDTGDARLTTRRTWLFGTGLGRTALVLSFGAAGRAPALALPVGAVVEGDLTPHEGSGQLRADPGEELRPAGVPAAPPPGGTVGAALDAYGRALRDDPWLDSWPVTLARVVPARAAYGWQLADADGREALPLTGADRSRPGLWRLLALSGGAPVTVFGELGHRGLTPLAAWSPEDPAETVPLL